MTRRLRRSGTLPCVRWLLLCCLLPAVASAHPMTRDLWSLRNAVKLDAEGLMAVIVLEIPDTVVVAELEAADVRASAADAGNPQAPTPSERRAAIVQAQRKRIWDQLVTGASLRIGGQRVDAAWAPYDTPVNGRAAAGFFQYLVAVSLPPTDKRLTGSVEVEVACTAFDEPKMVYSAIAQGGAGWQVLHDSSQAVLGTSAPDDPAAWSPDRALRTLQVRFGRAP